MTGPAGFRPEENSLHDISDYEKSVVRAEKNQAAGLER